LPGKTDKSERLEESVREAKVFRLLSRGFRYPSPEFHAGLASGSFAAELAPLLPPDSRREPVAEWCRAETDYGDFISAYISAFDAGSPSPPAPPYEGLHRSDRSRTEILLEVSAFYGHFGLRMSPAELPDHIAAELEFLHFLAFKRLAARQAGKAELLPGYLQARDDFLRRHLLAWITPFRRSQEAASAPLFYRGLSGFCERFAGSLGEDGTAILTEESAGGAKPPVPPPGSKYQE
jgi:putative dimethyl sulfoxide reductase chaperone